MRRINRALSASEEAVEYSLKSIDRTKQIEVSELNDTLSDQRVEEKEVMVLTATLERLEKQIAEAQKGLQSLRESGKRVASIDEGRITA